MFVGGFLGTAGAATAAPPSNDTFASATILERTLERNVSNATAGAGHQTGEPAHADVPAAASLWYRWNAPVDSIVQIDSDLTLSSSLERPAHELAVYTGARLARLTAVASLSGEQPSVRFTAKAGTTYQIAVNVPTRFAAEGFTHLDLVASPRNDNLAAATDIAGASGTATGYNEWATTERGEPSHSLYSGYDPAVDGTVWFDWTAPTTGFSRIGVECCAGMPPAVAVYTGGAMAGLQAVSSNYQCNVGAFNSCTSFFHTAGTAYHVAVQGHIDFEGFGRTFTLRWAPLASACSIRGTAAADTLVGTSGPDYICGLGGNDTIKGLDGDDVVVGGPGSDTIDYSGAPDAVEVDLSAAAALGFGTGTDALQEVENITGSTYADTLTGDAGANVLRGAQNRDTLVGGAGNDHLLGEGQKDVLAPGAGADTVDGGEGTDEVSYQDSPAVVVDLALGTTRSATGNDVLRGLEDVVGSDFADTILGDGLPNELVGGLGVDRLEGRAGNDRLYGWLGKDSMNGGAGADFCDGGSDDMLPGVSCETYVA